MDGATLGILIMYLVVLVIGLLIYSAIARAIFRVNENTDQMIQQTLYLKEIVENQKLILKNQEEAKGNS